jgi:adenine phosphoribosyltransferase
VPELLEIMPGNRQLSMMTKNADLAVLIRNIPDYPKPGIMFSDVSSLLLNADGYRMTIDRLAALVDPDTELVAGIEARGFIVASALAYVLGLGQLMLRKPGKLPGEKIGTDYTLEYGTDRIEMHIGQLKVGQKVLLVDDLIGKQEVVIKGMGETFEQQPFFSGAAILGDGRVALILDPDALGRVDSHRGLATEAALNRA